ncbi:hypothetical protein OEA41_000018 [Lepraria neglecta]|uniref:peptidylprolyl isomerase n=1 Tax=Lepraria neglecta TaxID=209136 RepID=A0AAD9ZF37_9LECA|nr:hypothetical protein OEA41_000018 [Lepraria neglecta]
MGVTRKLIKKGNGTEKPKKGDEVIIEYTGNFHDASVGLEKDFRGKQFDSSIGRGDFKTQIGVGKLIRGWDEGVTEMTLGEMSILTISGDYAYGDRSRRKGIVAELYEKLAKYDDALLRWQKV